MAEFQPGTEPAELRRPSWLRIGLLVAALFQLWPVASMAVMQSVPIGPDPFSCSASVRRKRVRIVRSVPFGSRVSGGGMVW